MRKVAEKLRKVAESCGNVAEDAPETTMGRIRKFVERGATKVMEIVAESCGKSCGKLRKSCGRSTGNYDGQNREMCGTGRNKSNGNSCGKLRKKLRKVAEKLRKTQPVDKNPERMRNDSGINYCSSCLRFLQSYVCYFFTFQTFLDV